MPFPDDLPENKQLLYWYDKDCQCDLLFWDILQKRTMLMVDRCYDGKAWCEEYSTKLYNAILPYTEFVMQYYPYKTNNIFQSGLSVPNKIYGNTNQQRLDTFKNKVVYYAWDSYRNANARNNNQYSVSRPQPLPDEFWSLFELSRLTQETITITLPKTQEPVKGSISYLVGMYRPFAYDSDEVYRQSFHRINFTTGDEPKTITIKVKNHKARYGVQQLPVLFDEVMVNRVHLSNPINREEFEPRSSYCCDICAGSVVVDCDSPIKATIESAFHPTLLYNNIDDTFETLYNSASEINKKWYRCGLTYSQNEGLTEYDWAVQPQGFLIYAYPLKESLQQYQNPDNLVTGEPLFIPLSLYDTVPIYWDDSMIYYTEQDRIYLGYFDGALSDAVYPNDYLIPAGASSAVAGNPNAGWHVWIYTTQFFPSLAIGFVVNPNFSSTIIDYIPCISIGSSKGSTYRQGYVLGESVTWGRLKIDAEPAGQNIYGLYYDADAFEVVTETYNNITNFRSDYNERFNSCPQKDYWKQLAMGEERDSNSDAMLNVLLEYMRGSYEGLPNTTPFFTQEIEDIFLGKIDEEDRLFPLERLNTRPDGYDYLNYYDIYTENAFEEYKITPLEISFRDFYADLYGQEMSFTAKHPSRLRIFSYEGIDLMTNPEKNYSSSFSVSLVSLGGGTFTGEANPPVEITYHPRNLHTHNWSILMTVIEKIYQIHTCLGAEEFAFDDTNKPYYMHMARKLDWLCKAWGLQFNPDGSMMDIRFRKNIPYTKGKATIPDGWARGQFADNKGGSSAGQTGGKTTEERLGIAYQNRCNRYENYDDADPKNNTMVRGDIVLCENLLQYFESYLEDMDKGLNWQEMGTGMLPSADGTSVCTYEGMGTLLAEVAYMLSSLSDNIYQTHNLSTMNYAVAKETLKALGIPLVSKLMQINSGESDDLGAIYGNMFVPAVADDAPSITHQLGIILTNIALVLSNNVQLPSKSSTPNP